MAEAPSHPALLALRQLHALHGPTLALTVPALHAARRTAAVAVQRAGQRPPALAYGAGARPPGTGSRPPVTGGALWLGGRPGADGGVASAEGAEDAVRGGAALLGGGQELAGGGAAEALGGRAGGGLG